MRGLSDLLNKLRQSLGQDVLAREKAIQCVKDILGFELEPKDISIKGDTLRITTTPGKRNEIKLHEAEIIETLSFQAKINLKRITY